MSDFVDTLELSVRTINVFHNEGIKTQEQFMALTRPVVMKMKGAGSRTWREIAEVQLSLSRQYDVPKRALALLEELNSLPFPDGYVFVVAPRGDYVYLAKLVGDEP